MKAARAMQSGPPSAIAIVDMDRPHAAPGEVLVKVHAAGVGPWDALIRSGQSKVTNTFPVTLGSDLAGIIEEAGAGVTEFVVGDAVYGVTNANFTGAYAEYAVASAGMIAQKPLSLSFIEAASIPVVAVTAWQMLFAYAHLQQDQTVLVHGGAGSVGAYAVQLAAGAGARVIATAAQKDFAFVTGLGASQVIDYNSQRFEEQVRDVDAVIDTVGGETLERSFSVTRNGGNVVSCVSPNPAAASGYPQVKFAFFIVEVTTACLQSLSKLFAQGKLKTNVGTIVGLEEARLAHEMLEGTPHQRGKIVIRIGE